MQTTVIKRDGRSDQFDPNRIYNAVYNAAVNDCHKDGIQADAIAGPVMDDVCQKCASMSSVSVEDIQDMVEHALMNIDKEVAKQYILYRKRRSDVRECKTSLMELFDDFTKKSSLEVNESRENANINADAPMGVMLKYGSTAAKDYNCKKVLTPEFASAHLNGDIHIHDLDFYSITLNCCQINLEKLFRNGFSTGHGFLREPNSIGSYSSLACIAIQSNQNDMFGGQSVPAFDYYMAPGVAKTFMKELCSVADAYTLETNDSSWKKAWLDDLKEKLTHYIEEHKYHIINPEGEEFIRRAFNSWGLEPNEVTLIINKATERTDRATFQAMEACVHNLNTLHSRAGAQVPFSSLNYGTDTSAEGRMVTKNLLLATEAGLGNGETCIFPVSIFKVKGGVSRDPGDPNYDLFKLACKVSAKRLFPNFSFMDAPFNAQFALPDGSPEGEVSYMGCVRYNTEIYAQNEETEEQYGTIGSLFDSMSSKLQVQHFGVSEYIDTSNLRLRIWDGFEDEHSEDFPNKKPTYVLKIIRNPAPKKWIAMDYSMWADHGYDMFERHLFMTPDHPLMCGKASRISAADLLRMYNEDGSLDGSILTNTEYAADWDILGITEVSLDDEYSYDVETTTGTFNVNGIWSSNCRTRVISNVYDPDRQTTSGRGNLSFTSINLPRLAIESHGDIQLFFNKLEAMMELVTKQLLERFEIQRHRHAYNFPFLMGEGVWMDSDKLNPSDELGDILKHGTLSYGFIGLAECLKALIGKHHGESEEARELGLTIVGYMNDFCKRKTKELGLNFTLIASPAEGLSGRFIRIDKKKYGIIPGVTDRDYYTNSFHVPVYYKIGIKEKIDIEAPYHAITPAGHITYVEVDGDPSQNLPAFESIIRYMASAGIGYGSINHPVDRDPVCGYTGIIGDVCPRCGRHEADGITREQYEELRLKYKLPPLTD